MSFNAPGANLSETTDIEDKFMHTLNHESSEDMTKVKDMTKRMLKYTVSSTLDEVLTNIYNEYIDDGNLLLYKRLEEEGKFDKTKAKLIFEKRGFGYDLTPDEIRFLYGKSISECKTLDEAFKKIDEKKTNLLINFIKSLLKNNQLSLT